MPDKKIVPDFTIEGRELLFVVRLANDEIAARLISLELGGRFAQGAIEAIEMAKQAVDNV